MRRLLWLLLPPLLACGKHAPPSPLRTLTIATGPKGAVFYPLGVGLAEIYTRTIPNLHVTARETNGAIANMDAIEKGEADLGFAQGDPAYTAFRSHTRDVPTPHSSLRAIGVLHASSLQIVVRRDSAIHRVTDLRGRRVGIGPAGSGTEMAAEIVLNAYGLTLQDILPEELAFEDASNELVSRSLDAHFVMSSTPASAITRAGKEVGIRLLSVEPAVMRRIRRDHSFYHPAVVPGGTYVGQPQDVQTLGVDNLLVCRATLEDDLALQLTRVLFESIDELAARFHRAAQTIDVDMAPATPIPLHPGAARFYREWQLFR